MHASLFGYAGHAAVKRALETIFVESLTKILGGEEKTRLALSAYELAVERGDEAAPELFAWTEAVDQAADVAFSQLCKPATAHFEIDG